VDYFKLRIRSDSRGPIYEKDYTPASALEQFVKLTTTRMAFLGMLRDGDNYWTTVTPQWGVLEKPSKMIFEPRDGAGGKANPGTSWVNIAVPEPRGEGPITSFTLDLYSVTAEPVHYRWSFPASELEYLRDRAKPSLVKRGILAQDEAVGFDIFVLTGSDIDFERENILNVPAPIQALQDQVSIIEDEEEWAVEPMPHCACGEAETDEGLVIFVRQDAWEKINEHVALHGSRHTESGGILVGDVRRRSEQGSLYVKVEDFIAATQTRADAISLKFTHETWQMLQRDKRERFPDKRVVGWYHTHPPVLVKEGGKEVETVAFFSPEDRQMHLESFPEPWQVALVMDGDKRNPGEPKESLFFRWEGKRIVPSRCHIYA
jgi:proteasome lid subunit RPN8/RPN11